MLVFALQPEATTEGICFIVTFPPDLRLFVVVGERGASLVGRCTRWSRPSTQVLPLISGEVEPDGGGEEEPEEPV